MVKVVDVIEKLELVAPLDIQEVWDNSGWQIDLGNKNTNKILLALNVTESVVDYAIDNKCDLIISHHPLIFAPLKMIKNKVIIKAIQNNIQIYSMHTNFDKAEIGTTQTLVEKFQEPLNIKSLKDVNDFVKIATLKETLSSDEFLAEVKDVLSIKYVKYSKSCAKIKKVAFCAGAGADFSYEVQRCGADCFVTSDIKYHQALEASLMLVDIGHFESEIIALDSIKKLLSSLKINIILSNEEPSFKII